MHVSVISAERAVFDGEAESVVAPAFDGLVGILPRHAPFMTLLGEGVVKISQAGGTLTRLSVMGGFLQVASNVVRIVARRAGPADS
ncbi:MAG: F0F1 ATP synthase subunit epsilon [Gemmatimonadetes bacterium]|nr:MAG: F0F1 ATP synthase subunit epsilon [Gemmatimonadota bacterium]